MFKCDKCNKITRPREKMHKKAISYRDRVYELNNRIEKAIETLYCWGEILDTDFQNKMLNILKGNDEDYVRADVYEETLNKIEKR